MESNALLVLAYKKLCVGGTTLDPAQIQVNSTTLGHLATEISFGPFRYSLKFTKINQEVYRVSLNDLRDSLGYEGPKPLNTIDPTGKGGGNFPAGTRCFMSMPGGIVRVDL
jgi:hypothetical protein